MKSRTVLVTGGSRGIGAAIARLAGSLGWLVVIGYSENSRGAQSVVEDIEDCGGSAIAIQANICSVVQVEKMFSAIDTGCGQLDALVNNAADTPRREAFLKSDIQSMKRVVETNTIGTMNCLHFGVSRMALSRGGNGGIIVNITSEAGRFGGDRISSYAASKASLNALTIGLARELAPDGIRVNAVSPGVIDTESNFEPDPTIAADRASKLPMGRLGTPEEVAKVVLWLLSDSASYVSGAIIPVTGGR